MQRATIAWQMLVFICILSHTRDRVDGVLSNTKGGILKTFLKLCAVLLCAVSPAALAWEFVEAKTTSGCELKVQSFRPLDSTYTWDGECIGGKAEGMGTFVQKVRLNDNLSDLYYSTQTRHAGAVYGYTTFNASRRDPALEIPEKVTFYFGDTRIAFTKGWGWSLEGLLVGGKSMSLPRSAPAEPFPSMRIESPTGVLTLVASTCATDMEQIDACKTISERYRTIYLIRESEMVRDVVKGRKTTPCPDLFNIASCQSMLAQKSAPLRAEILAFLESAKPSVDDLLDKASKSRPNDRPLPAAAQIPPPLAQAAVAPARPGIVDAPLPVFDTKVPYETRLGSMLWLDANTLAITTSKDGQFWNGTTVAVDVAARNASVILERGFLNCTNDGLVAMIKGSLGRQYAGSFMEANPPDPVKVFYRWNASAKRLEAEESESKPGWSWQICAQTQAQHIRLPSIGYHDQPIRYLKARDGVLRWEKSDSRGGTTQVLLAKPGSAPAAVDVDAADIVMAPQYLPFSDQYLLTAGRFHFGAGPVHKGKMTDELPAITMTRDGRVIRHTVPLSLKSLLGKHTLSSDGQTQPTAAGLLVINGATPVENGGLYLSHNGAVKRVWCIPSARGDQRCDLDAMQVSPDGCQLAFVEKNSANTVKIMQLCSPARSK